MSKRPKPSSQPSREAKKNSLDAKRYLTQLLASTSDHEQVLHSLKQESWDVHRQVFDALAAYPHLRRRILGEPFPSDFESLSAHTLGGAGNRYVAGLKEELHWSLSVLRFHKEQVNAFLTRKRLFERALLARDLHRAQSDLGEHFSQQGASLWLIDASLQVASRTPAEPTNGLLAEHLAAKACTGMVQAFTLLLSLRAERLVSLTVFDSELRRLTELERLETEAPGTAFHVLFRLNRSSLTSFPDDMLSVNLDHDYDYALADRVQTFIKTIQVVLARNSGERIPFWLPPLVSRASMLFEDERLHAAHLLLSGAVWTREDDLMSRLAGVIERYTAGDYSEAAALARRSILADPDCFEFYELYCACLLRLRILPDLPDAAQAICERLLSVEIRDRGASDALGKLAKSAVELDATRFGGRLEAWIRARLPDSTGIDPIRWEALHATVPTPRSALALPSTSAAAKLLRELQTVGGMPITAELFRKAISGVRVSSAVAPEDRALKYSAWSAERRGDYKQAAEDYTHLINILGENIEAARFAREALYRCLVRIGELPAAVDLVITELLSGETIYFPAQIPPMVHRLQKSGGTAVWKLAAWPILVYEHTRASGVSGDNHEVYAALVLFLSAHGAERPSELRTSESVFPPRQLLYLLRFVCVPDVLDWSLEFTSPEDLDHERIAILDWLESIDPESGPVYEEERAQITRRIVLQKGLSEINRGKIYVDTAGIKKELGKQFIERLLWYMRSRPGTGAFPDMVPSVQVAPGGRVILHLTRSGIVRDDGFLLFRELHHEVRNRFLWSDHCGLDSCLSVELRHGNVSGQLRPPFERAKLITQRDATEGRYAPNQFWLDLATKAPDHILGQLDWTFASFAGRIDALIEDVKDCWIRIRSTDHHPDGLFDYEFTDEELREVRSRADTDDDSPAVFITAIFDSLWQRTRKNLEAVKAAIRTRLTTEFYAALTTLESDVQTIYPRLAPPIRQHVANCRTDLDEELRVLEGWFAVDEVSALSDYDLELLLETVLYRVRRLQGIEDFSPRTQILGNISLQGRTFRALYNVLYLVVENVIAHARERRNTADILIEVQGDTLRIHVGNDTKDEACLEELERTAPELEAKAQGGIGTSVVRQEGKSGYSKLGKLLRSDLQRAEYTVTVAVTEGKRFEVSVSIPLTGLCA